MGCTQTMGRLAVKRHEARKNLENAVLSERSRTQKAPVCESTPRVPRDRKIQRQKADQPGAVGGGERGLMINWGFFGG